MKLTCFLLSFFLFVAGQGIAQTDTEFWFVAPDCSAGHAESPNYLRITAQSLPSVVTITQPANPGFANIIVNIPANSLSTIDLSTRLSAIENTPYNQVLNKGLKITATNPVTAYYEQASGLNPDIFPLKGKNALGTDFLIITQNTWRNRNFSPTAYNKFDIVATEDNTTVTITPSKNIFGHASNVPYTITLNTGQTYCASATGTAALDHLVGSSVTSDKPIAITMSDDSIEDPAYGGCGDLAGDQLVPVGLFGFKYISIHGYLNGANDKVFVMASQANTQIKIDGLAVATLNRGQVYSRASNGLPMYIEADKPVSAFHISGFGCEVGGAILPQIECTGSKEVGVSRSENKPIYFNILVPAGGEGNFKYNGSTSVITASQFQFVPGSGNTWKYARIDIASTLSVGGTGYVTNSTDNFHLGLIHGDANTGCRYGYFSEYNRFDAKGASNSPLCVGNNLQLNCNVTGSLSDVTFNWTGPNGFSSILQNPVIPNATIAATGTYNCIATKSGCTPISFSVNVVVNTYPGNTATSNSPVCAGGNLNFSTSNEGAGAVYSWTGPNGFASALQNPVIPNASTINTGPYTLLVSKDGCDKTRTINVAINTAPTAIATNTGPYCGGQKVLLKGSSNNNGVTYFWSGPNGFSSNLQNPSINNAQQNATGIYTLKVSQPGCTDAFDTTNVFVLAGPGVSTTGVSPVCAGDNISINGSSTIAGVTFNWTGPAGFSSTTQSVAINNVKVNQGGNYILTVALNGCASSDTFYLTVNSIANFVASGNTPLCDGDTLQLSATPAITPLPNANYTWTGPNGFSSSSITNKLLNATALLSGTYTLTGSAPACAAITSQLVVLVKPRPIAVATSNAPVCANQSLQLEATNTLAGTLFTWTGPSTFNSTKQRDTIFNPGLNAAGTYTLTASLNGCSAKSSVAIVVNPIPNANIGSTFPACRFSMVNLTNNNSVPNTIYKWYTAFNSFTSNASNLTIARFDYADTGKYYLSATSNNCTDRDSVIATLNPSPDVLFPPLVNICQEKPGFSLTANETTGIAGSGLFSGNGVSITGYFDPKNAGPGVYLIRYAYTAINGCTNYKEQPITVYPSPAVDGGANKIIMQGSGIRLSAMLTGGIGSIIWSPAAGLSNTTILTPIASPIISQTYNIAVTTSYGCFATDTVNVKVLGKLKIPNSFSPNGDGINDSWKIDGLPSYLNCDVAVFNRYGVELYRSSGYQQPWDGKYKGSVLPTGTYYYIIVLNDGFRTEPFSGWVMLFW